MCGIIGYIGRRQAMPIVMNGLKRMEYRGYDSAGVCFVENQSLQIRKQAGKLYELEKDLVGVNFDATVGMGHTRWATHGVPNQTNAHPHFDEDNNFAVIHNGIIENYASLKIELVKKGHTFKTETDTETVIHLVEEFYKSGMDFETAVREAIYCIKGAYGFVFMCRHEPEKIIVARCGSPLVLGYGNEEFLVASDASAIVAHTRQVVYLEDNEMAILSRQGIEVKTLDNKVIEKQVEEITFDISQIEKAGYEHFMLKEIFEQPNTIRDAMRGRLIAEEGMPRLGGLVDHIDTLKKAKKIVFIACGTSWHAALTAEYMIEEFARINVEVEYASEFRYRNPIVEEGTVVFVISQSGETADTLAAMREAKRRGAAVFGICNVVGSSIARETDAGVYIHAGPEIGVASTKAFTSQLTVIALITVLLARLRNMSSAEGKQIVEEMDMLPEKVKEILKASDYIREIAELYKDRRNFLYLGRGYNFPVALEGALKLKEISYIHAEGYPAAEMKHGPIALIDEEMPIVFIAPQDAIYDKVVSNIEEVRARGGKVIAITTEGNTDIRSKADHIIYIPKTMDFLIPILSVIPLQLLSYHMAVLRGCNVDQPRNLAKSVTVE
ncbi:MAG TPA: glutamine--fructose-6-phosphate transaminase (isomerizing) [bacterium]|nr:glutamine--fructose-6-phosphate transaminase (isomerizing) [bacterium]HMW35399.1 glutamine--fructose-6-phosphate transaminase (isomerizing) [bacterium]HMY35380.1 glutamine--fructose-6-phosphate transaminase (isomerizing) [bacterium]HMZ04628.1 glutamine--fructose-6-phosphate transaminase (isomerizing) [bacterium]HNB09035.1 glutamine--fructose-6-phosphate transaminase (isomerizing) [bacterium]